MKCDIHIWNQEDNSTCWKCNELKYKDRLQMDTHKVKIIDDIPEGVFMFLEDFLLSSDTPWFWNPATTHMPENSSEAGYNVFLDKNTKETPQFTHSFIVDNRDTSKYAHFVSDVKNYINECIMPIEKIVRVKANLLVKDENYPNKAYHPPHSDVFGENYDKQWTFLYYINDSDGDTIIFDREWHPTNGDEIPKLNIAQRYRPTAGTALLFKSNQYHTSSPPKITDRRVVLNFVFEPKEEKIQ